MTSYSLPTLKVFASLGVLSLTGCLKSSEGARTTPAPVEASPSYQGLGADSLDPQMIQQYAPPAIPPDLKRQIEFMLDVRPAPSGFASEDGHHIYFTWNITGRPQVWRLNRHEGFPVQLTGGEDRTWIVSTLPQHNLLVIQRDRAGQENPGIYLLKPSGGRLKKIYHKDGVRTSVDHISGQGDFIYFSANDPKPDSMTIYRYEISSGHVQKIFDRPGLWSVADSQGTDRLLLAKQVGSLQTEFYEWNLHTKELKSIFGQDKKEQIWMAYGPDENSFIVLTNMFSDFRRLYQMKDGSFTPISQDVKADVISFQMDKAKKYIAHTLNQDGYFNVLVSLTTAPQKALTIKAPQAQEVQLASFTWNSKFAIAALENSGEPGSTYLLDLEKMAWSKVLIPSAPEVDLESFAETSLEFFTARDGTKVPMLVRRPLACQEPCPVIVNFHGGPEAQALPGFSPYAQIFVDAGFVFVEPNVRGSDGYGKDYLAADDGPKRLNVISDIEDSAKHIRTQFSKGGVAPKIGVMGGSYGGYSAFMGMTKFAGAFDAGVAIVGISNLLTFLQNTAPYRRQLRISEYGDPDKDKEALHQLSPTTYLDNVKGPLLIIQGVSDPRVPAGESVQIHQRLRAKGLDSQLILFANEGHGSVDRANRVLQIGHALGFFKKHLQ